ncbi:MAG: hypothetical protein FJ086_15550 [Deltaproteobacteria bacterium]|nr:hypothetical protein [Deltaproteobacteria bacterium]
MAAPRRTPRRTKGEHAARVRHLLSLDAANVMARLAERQDEMVGLFSRLRNREPLLEPLQSWFSSIAFPELVALSPAEQRAANGFYEQLGQLRWYLQYTEDMPGQVQLKLSALLRKLEATHAQLVGALGPPDASGAQVVNAEVVPDPEKPASAPRALRRQAAGADWKRSRTT